MAEIITKSGSSLPYVMAYGNIKKTLDAIIQAAVPDRFTQDFLTTKLSVKGGSGKMVLPFLKKVGFLNSDGTPTDVYSDFRIESSRPRAANTAILTGYSLLGEMNEYFYELEDKELKDLVVRATGMASGSSTVNSIVGSIKSLKEYANFSIVESSEATQEKKPVQDAPSEIQDTPQKPYQDNGRRSVKERGAQLNDFRLGYTININLPSSSDISVYNAIFKSLKENILDE